MDQSGCQKRMIDHVLEREPRLKYESLGGDVTGITSSGDEITCLCLSDKILAIGTAKGNVHVLDYSGNQIRCLDLHAGRVNELSFDRQEEHLASCSDDCSVTVVNLYTDVRQRYASKLPVKTVALDPRYASRKSKEYVSAGDQGLVTLSSQGWLGRSDTPLFEGSVQLVRWSDSLVAWGSDKAVTVYDTNQHVQIRTITRYKPVGKKGGGTASPAASARSPSPPPTPPPPVPGRITLLFGQNRQIYMSWPDCIKVARIIPYDNNIGGLTHQIEVVLELTTDYLVLGVAPFGEDLAVLTYPTSSLPVTSSQRDGGEGSERGVEEEMHHAPSPEKPPLKEASSGPSWEPTPGPVMAVEQGLRPQLRMISTSNQLLAVDDLTGFEGGGSCRHTDYHFVPSLPVMTSAAAAAPKGTIRGRSTGGGAAPPEEEASASPSTTEEQRDRQQGFKAEEIESMYFIVAPQGILVSRSRDLDDHTLWLLDQGRFEEALLAAEGGEGRPGVKPATYEKVVQGYIDALLHKQAYEAAARLSPRLLKGNAAMWEQWVYLFAQTRQLPKLAPYIPTESPRLRDTAYEMVLRSLLAAPEDHPTLLHLVRAWPPGLFSMPSLMDAVTARMKRPPWPPPAATPPAAPLSAPSSREEGDYPDLWRLMAMLYQRQGRPDLSLSILLQLRSPDVFDFIDVHSLASSLVGGRAIALLEIDEAAALRLLTRHVEILSPSDVVPSLQGAMDAAGGRGDDGSAEVWRRRLYRYLAGVMELDASVAADYHELQIHLTADYAPSKLMDLLTASQYYPLEAALAICQRRGMVSEQVYILGRMGSAKQALHLIIEKLGDIPQAIEFVRSQRDEELWDYLITWALGSSETTGVYYTWALGSSETTGSLMDHVGGYINPLTLIQRLPKGLTVPRLRDRLRCIIGDFRTQTSLHEGCSGILRSDCMHLMHKLYHNARHCMPLCYVRWQSNGASGQAHWQRYDSMTGELEPVPTHCLPSVVTDKAEPSGLLSSSVAAASSVGRSSHQAGEVVARPGGSTSYDRRELCWVGFNVEDAATHIKLESKEEDSPGSGQREPGRQTKAAAVAGRVSSKNRPSKGGMDDGRQRGSGGGTGPKTRYDPAAWDPQSGASPGALPSLIRR